MISPGSGSGSGLDRAEGFDFSSHTGSFDTVKEEVTNFYIAYQLSLRPNERRWILLSEEKNKALIRRYFEAIDKGDAKILDEFISPEIVVHNLPPGMPQPGLEGAKKIFNMFYTATPDGYHTIDDLIAEGDKVAARVTGYGTHEGDLFGIPPTHKKIKMSGFIIWRIKDGKIVEAWGLNDTLDLLQQLGASPQDLKPPSLA